MKHLRSSLLGFSALCASLCMQAQQVETVQYAGPYQVNAPVVLDSMDVMQHKYDSKQLMKTPLSLDLVKTAAVTPLSGVKPQEGTLNLVGFSFRTTSYVKTQIKVEGPAQHTVYLNGREMAGEEGLAPGYYEAVVKFVADSASLRVSLEGASEGKIRLQPTGGKRPFTLDDNMEMKYITAVSLSPSGRYAIYSGSWFNKEGKAERSTTLKDLTTGNTVLRTNERITWMPRSDRYYRVRSTENRKSLVVTDPQNGQEEVLVANLPSTSFYLSPAEDYLVFYTESSGPAREDGVYEIVHPDDRQPGWRSRSSMSRLDLATGLVQPLTYGYRNAWISDISQDGKYALLNVNTDSITLMRPTTLTRVYRLNMQTLEMEQLVENDGFIGNSYLLPDPNKVLFMGSAEAFGGIGNQCKPDQTPSMYEYELFMLDIPSGKVTHVTHDFNPSISQVEVSQADGQVYFTAEKGEYVSLYRLDPKSLKITEIEQPIEVIGHFGLARNTPQMLLSGTSACVADRLYSLNTKTRKTVLVDDPNADRMAEIQLGTCHSWSTKVSGGYTVTGFYYLPADFDASRQYPMILDYYGGCSPTSRRFGGGSHYPAHYWNALGYVVLIVNPSGCSGFGQEWAARHVNTMGEGVAQDMIEFAQTFAREMPWINEKKVGCVSASYGGFMTQCMLTKTDFFATGISHAGISDHTSYWGEGFWGYSYSQTSAANTYPWTRKDLYVDRSPLYNADKIHTPILFTHGTADTNVPIGESIQMYTAMKLLGVPTAFVMVEGENHGIMDYKKRIKWINTMVAWFQRYLQDDDSWWNAIYVPKDL